MHKFTLFALAFVGSGAPCFAQGCTGPAAAQQFSNRQEFAVNFYYGLADLMFDIDAQVPLTINGFSTWMYDQGVGNPVVPNQVGGTGPVDFYEIPATYVGNEATGPAAPWNLLGTGTLTIAAYPAESQIVFSTPVVLPAGAHGVALVFGATTTGPNPGMPLHCLGVSAPPVPVSDQYMTMSGEFIQGVAWTGTTGGGPNLRIDYDVPTTAAHFSPLGQGCYFRPQGFYEEFPSTIAGPDLQNTSQFWIYQPPSGANGANYLIVPGTASVTPSTSPSLTLGTFGSSSSATWDDALSAPIQLPFVFDYAGGSTDWITIGSNGCIYLEQVVDNSYAICGAAYGSIVPFRDGPPRICPFLVDLDPSAGGTLHYDVDPSGNAVIITWDNVPEWGVASPTTTMQVTLTLGGQVDISYGTVSHTTPGDTGIAGFSRGYGDTLGDGVDLSALIAAGFTTGDNAIPPILTAESRPVIGTTTNIITSNLTPGTILGALAAGQQVISPALDLGSIGMPGCELHTNFFILLTQTVDPVSGNFINPLVIPANAALQDQQFVFQSAPFTGGFNSLGLVSSNGLCMRLGT